MTGQVDTGTILSGVGHATLIGWALVAGLFNTSPDAPDMAVTEVTLVSVEDFAALSNTPVETPPETSSEAPVAPTPPEPDTPEPPPAPVAVEEPPTPPEPVTPAEPPAPETPPDLTALEAPPVPEVAVETPPAPVPPVLESPPGGAATLEASPRPVPRRAEVIAPQPTPEPEPEASPDIDTQTATAPEPAPEVTEETETQEATTPEPTGETTALQEEEPAGGLVLAPTGSPRPAARPRTLARPPAETTQDAVADAVADAVSEATETPARSAGPPMTAGEKDALRVAVQRCWNVGSLSTDALRVTVTVGVSLGRDGKPDSGSIRMLESSDGNSAAARQAYEAARRAVIRCGARGFALPEEKYETWRDLELVFNPERMRVR